MQELLKPKEGWEVKKLGEVAELRKGQLITEKTAVPGNTPVIGGGMSISYYNDKANRKENTITVSASGANAGFVSFHDYPIFASDCTTIEECPEFDIRFLYFTLLSKQNEICKLQTGGAQPHVYSEQLRNLIISIPEEREEQRNIVRMLTDMDAELEVLEMKLEKHKMIKQGMMQNLLTGKIRLL
jgi:type I restriction enzyme S subunit